MKGKNGFFLGTITGALGLAAAAVAINRGGHNVVDELDSRIPNPLFKKTKITPVTKSETPVEPVVS